MRLATLITPELLKKAMAAKSNPEHYEEVKKTFAPVITALAAQLKGADPKTVFATALTMLVMVDDALHLLPEDEVHLRRKTDVEHQDCDCNREACRHPEGCRRRGFTLENGTAHLCSDCALASLAEILDEPEEKVG